VVHAGYAKRRKALLAAGITLFELKRGSSGSKKRVGWTGRSGSRLLRVQPACQDVRCGPFAGVSSGRSISIPFGPAEHRNGFVIDSAALADALAPAVRPRSAGPAPIRLVWATPVGCTGIDRHDGGEVVRKKSPVPAVWRRFAVALLSVLPIEWLL